MGSCSLQAEKATAKGKAAEEEEELWSPVSPGHIYLGYLARFD